MPMSMKTEGLEELSGMLAQLGDKAEDVATGALYDGAGVVADAFSRAVANIRTEPFKYKKAHRLPSPEEKAALAGKTGIAKFNKNGTEVDTLVGVTRSAGHVKLGSRETPVLEIARSINSGTSFMTKQPIFRRAASSSKREAENTMIEKAEQMLQEIIGD